MILTNLLKLAGYEENNFFQDASGGEYWGFWM